ncbi:MAG: hypothetical protein KTR20_02390 [Cellvibrionaceae bacterium]|nr:hypothetical protein [Cellvibrionaceae bacterium]
MNDSAVNMQQKICCRWLLFSMVFMFGFFFKPEFLYHLRQASIIADLIIAVSFCYILMTWCVACFQAKFVRLLSIIMSILLNIVIILHFSVHFFGSKPPFAPMVNVYDAVHLAIGLSLNVLSIKWLLVKS